MIIRCPSCLFERGVPDEAVAPGKRYKVTCPRCSEVFHFSRPEGVEEAAEQGPAVTADAPETAPAAPAAAPEAAPAMPEARLAAGQDGTQDDPLPPGAEIPRFRRHAPVEEEKAEERSEVPKDVWDDWQERREREREAGPEDERQYREDGLPMGAPWEHPEFYGFWGSFAGTLMGALFHPARFFRNVRCPGTVIKPLLFYVLLNVFQMLASRLWSIRELQEFIATATDPQKLAMAETMMQAMNMPLMLLITPFFAVFQAVILAGLYHLMLRIVQPDRADFYTTLRVVCYSSAALVMCIVPLVGSLIAQIWFVFCIYAGCKYALNMSWLRTGLALLPLYILELALVSQVATFMASAM